MHTPKPPLPGLNVLVFSVEDFSQYPPGPQGIRILSLVSELSQFCNVTLVGTTPIHGGNILGTKYIHLPYRMGQEELKRPWKVIRLRRLYRALEKLMDDYDLVYTDATYYPGLVSRAHAKGKRHIVEVNGILGIELSMKKYLPLMTVLKRILPAMEKRTLSKTDRIICVTPQIAAYIQEYTQVPREKTITISNGVDMKRFNEISDERVRWVRKKYDLKEGKTIAYMSTFRPWHRAEGLIPVFSNIIDKVPDAKLLMIGDGPMREQVENITKDAGLSSVVFTGTVPYDHVPAYLKACDIGVHLPYFNGQSPRSVIGESPLKMGEYMASGLPVVMSDVPYASDILSESGGGIVAHNENEAAEHIVRLLQDDALRHKMGATAHEYVIKNLSMSIIARRIYKAIR